MAQNTKIKELRVRKGESQNDLAELLGITRQAYSKKELGQRAFNLEEMCKLSEHFRSTLDDIFLPLSAPERGQEEGDIERN